MISRGQQLCHSDCMPACITNEELLCCRKKNMIESKSGPVEIKRPTEEVVLREDE